MRPGSAREWAETLGVGAGDLPFLTRMLIQSTDSLDGAIIRMRTTLHECPDEDLAEALLELERQMRLVVARVRELHVEVLREMQ